MGRAQTGIEWLSYLGGSGNDDQTSIAVDPLGNVYVAGATVSTDFPTTPAALRRNHRPSASRRSPSHLGFLAKLDPAGRRLLYGTYLGGSVREGAATIAVDQSGNIFVGGSTDSPDFPVTRQAPQKRYAGLARGGNWNRPGDGFLVVLDPEGRLRFSTYLGGQGSEGVSAMAVDEQGFVYAAGVTDSETFAGAAKETSRPPGAMDAFVLKLGPNTGEIRYIQRIGGSGSISVAGIALNRAGEVFVAGSTDSPDLPATQGAPRNKLAGASDAFLFRLSPQGRLRYLTYWGGKKREIVTGLSLDVHDAAYVAGWTNSEDFSTTKGAFQSVYRGGSSDGFVIKIEASGKLGYATLLGGSGFEDVEGIAVDRLGRAHMAGRVSAQSDLAVTEEFTPPAPGASEHAFYGMLDDQGRLLQRSLRVGGSGQRGNRIFRVSRGAKIALDAMGNAYVVANTTDDVAVTKGAYQELTAGGHEMVIFKVRAPR